MLRSRDDVHIIGAFEHPGRHLPDRSLTEIYADVCLGAARDAGIDLSDVDGFFCGMDAPGDGWVSLAEYLGLTNLRYAESTESGGASPLSHIGHAVAAIREGRRDIALVALAGKPRTGGGRAPDAHTPGRAFREPVVRGAGVLYASYALAQQRHMYEYGTTSAQLAAIKVAASVHAQYNPNAFIQRVMTVDEVLDSPLVSDPIRRADCCVVTDGGGAIILVSDAIARSLPRRSVLVRGYGEAPKFNLGGHIDLTFSGARWSGPRAFEDARVSPADIDYVSIYDSFTITVLQCIEDLGFCEKGEGGRFVADGALIAPFGALPFNTDGGGLCNNHPGNRGGITKAIETVRQLRGEAHPAVQVPDCRLGIAHGNGGDLGTRMRSVTVVLEAVA